MKIKFYLHNTRWFADLPEYLAQGGEVDDCEMICGADILCDIISQGQEYFWMSLSENNDNNYLNKLELSHTDDSGGYYKLKSYNNIEYNLDLWLCNVTLFLFKNFPETIYFN